MSEVQKILKKAWEHGYYSNNHPSDPNMTWFNDDMQSLYDLLMEKMPPMIAIVEIPDFPESRLFAEAYAKGEVKGHNEAVALMVSAINQLFGRTE